MARDNSGEHIRTSNVQRFPIPETPGRTKENMFDFVVKGAQNAHAERLKNQGEQS